MTCLINFFIDFLQPEGGGHGGVGSDSVIFDGPEAIAAILDHADSYDGVSWVNTYNYHKKTPHFYLEFISLLY